MIPVIGRFLVFLFLLYMAECSWAINTEWTVRAFRTNDGLAYEVVRDVALSPDQSTAWMATWGGGVSRYDGTAWYTLNKADGLPNDSVRSVLIEKSGAVWIGTDGGIACYEGDQITPYLTSNTEGLPNNRIFTIHRINQELWFSTADGHLIATQADLPSGSKRIWRKVIGPDITGGNAVRDVLVAQDGKIWLACSRTGIFYSEDGGTSWNASSLDETTQGSFHGIAQARDGTIWAAGGSPLIFFNGTTWERSSLDAESSTCVAVTPDGETFLGTNGGLFLYRKGEWELIVLDEEDLHQYIECIIPVEDGSVWVGTRHGVFRLSRPSWTPFLRTSEGENLIFESLSAVPGSSPLALEEKGNLVKFVDKDWVPVLRLTGITGATRCTLTHPREGKVWVLTTSHAFHCSLDPPAILKMLPLPPDAPPRILYEEEEGRLWLLTNKGAFDLEGETWRPQPAIPGYRRSQTYCLVKDASDGYWVGLEDRVEYWRDDQIKVFPAEGDLFPGLPPLQSISTAMDGRLLFATSSTGIMILEGSQWTHYSSSAGLLTNRIRCVHEAADRTLWVGNRESWISCRRNGRWTSFRLSDGIPAASILSLGESSDGSIWAAVEGACILRYRRDSSPPNTILQALDTELNPGEVGFFSFGGRDTWDRTMPTDLEYSWRIVAADQANSEQGWSSYSSSTLALTPRLDPGRYLFQTRALDKDGNVDPTPASVSLLVLPPLWKQPAFSIPVALLSLIALIALGIGFAKHLAMRKSEERYRNLVDDALTVIIKWNARGEITFWNEYAERVFGYPREDVLGRTVIGTILPDGPYAGKYLEDVTHALFNQTNGPLQRHHDNLRRDGTTIHMSWTYRPILSDDKSLLEVHAFGVDSTEQHRAEQALAESEEMHRTLVERATDAILIVQDGCIQYANPQLFTIFGYTPEDILGAPIERFIPESERDQILSNYQRRLAGEDLPGNYESLLVDHQGRRVDVELRAALITYKGHPATLVLIHDITQRKAAQEAAMRSSRMEATATLAGGIAHDFNNLMVGVLGYTDLLRLEFQDREEVTHMLDRISRSAERAGELARQMLAYARGGKYQPRKIDLNKIIRDTVKMLSRDIPERIRHEQVLYPDLPQIEADPAQMTEIVSGLLNNAVEAIDGNGTITLETGVVSLSSEDHIPGLVLFPGTYVHLTVSDSGAGMEKTTLSRIYEPFFTTKFQGRGLGLSAVFGIVKNHGGDIMVCSEKGRGTIAKVFLPVNKS